MFLRPSVALPCKRANVYLLVERKFCCSLSFLLKFLQLRETVSANFANSFSIMYSATLLVMNVVKIFVNYRFCFQFFSRIRAYDLCFQL